MFESLVGYKHVTPTECSAEQQETIGFICVRSPAVRDFLYGKLRSIELAGLALICLKNETKADAERDLRDLISAAGTEVSEKASRERLLRHLESADKGDPLELAKYSLERAGASSSEMDLKR